MVRGGINHLSLTVSDRDQSEPFYETLLTFLGYQQVEKTDEFTMWWSESSGGAILISSANPNSPNKNHDRYSPGLHHLAFEADSREDVENLYKLLLEIGATVLDAPAEYNQ